MTDVWFTVGVPAAVSVSTVWYTTGGRAARARRAIREDMELVGLLPPGQTRDALEKVAGEKAMRYASTWIGTQPLTVRQHLVLGAGTAVGALLYWCSSKAGVALRPHHQLSGFLLGFAVSGLGLVALCLTYWISSILTADKAKERAASLRLQKQQVSLYMDDDEPSHGCADGTPPGAVCSTNNTSTSVSR